MGKTQSNTTSTSSSTPTFINTNTTNPYYQTKTDKNGNTTNSFVKGTAGATAYNFVNKNAQDLLNSYLNPSLDTTTNQAKLAQFNKQQQANLQNNIISPLANNNMIRSSQATNMYNNLSNQAADYANDLLANSQNDTWNMINNLMSLYTAGYTGANTDVSTALKAATGQNTTTSSNTKA